MVQVAASETMPLETVVLDTVTKRFGAIRALDRVDLSIGRGVVLALLGANGAGKSTLMDLLTGVTVPDAGSVRVFGRPPAEAVMAGRVGVMLQDGGFMPGVRVGALVELVSRWYPAPRPTAQVLAAADLTAIAHRRVDRLSGGQAQRLRFALAVVGDPDLLLLDEPTNGMDVGSRRRFWAVVRSSAGEGCTVVFATHYLHEAEEFADQVVVLAAGRVALTGTVAGIATSAGTSRVRFTLGEPAEGMTDGALRGLPGVVGVRLQGGTAVLDTTDAEATVRALLAVRHQVAELEVVRPGLDEAVLAHTGPVLHR